MLIKTQLVMGPISYQNMVRPQHFLNTRHPQLLVLFSGDYFDVRGARISQGSGFAIYVTLLDSIMNVVEPAEVTWKLLISAKCESKEE
jgi:hypothetical protein